VTVTVTVLGGVVCVIVVETGWVTVLVTATAAGGAGRDQGMDKVAVLEVTEAPWGAVPDAVALS